MSLTQTIPFTDGSNFNYDPAFIEFPGTLARLKKQIQALTYSQLFDSDVGFTYDAAKAEFVASEVLQKDQRPAGATFGATFTDLINGNWGGGTLAGTPFGGAAVAGGKLVCTGGSKYVRYSAVGNADSLQTGCVRFKLTPNYSGTPATTKAILVLSQDLASVKNLIGIYHFSTGNLVVGIASGTGATIVNALLGAWAPVSGTEYEIELNWDITSGVTRLFVNGVQFGSTMTGTGVRSGAVGYMTLNAYYDSTAIGDASYNDVEIFPAVQHTVNYTPGYIVPETIYAETVVTAPAFVYLGVTPMLGYTAFAADDTNAPHYALNGQYWNGSAWVASNGSYAQSNTAAVVGTNIGTLPVGSTLIVGVVFGASGVKMSTHDLLVSYNGQLYTNTDQSIEVASGVLTDDLVSVTADFDAPTNTQLGFFLEVAGVKLYWDGLAWSVSDETIAKTNTIAQINANVGSLDLALGKNIKLGVVLKSTNQLITPTITSAAISYNFRAAGATDPATCSVWAFLFDLLGEEVTSGATLTAELSESFEVGERIVGASKKMVIFDATGYAQIQLVQSVAAGKVYSFTINWTDPSGKARTINFVDAVVPAQDEISLMDLTNPQ